MDDGRIGHAELALSGGVLYLADEYPEIGLKAPAPRAASVSLMLAVPDTDTALERARERGAEVQSEPYENYGNRNATIIDPFGHRWMLTGPVTGAAVPIQHGDVGYVSVWTPDAERAAAFYGHVLGWTYDPETHQVTNTKLHMGLYSVADSNTLFCCYAVADLQGARDAIVAAGGTVDEFEEFEFGRMFGATDPQGSSFAVFQPAPGMARPELNGAGPGELSYITYEVTDSAAFRSFYSGLLFWTFEPGRIDDGWQVQQTHPMAGVAGGSAQHGHRADVDRRRHRRRGGPGPRGRRHRHRRAVTTGLRILGAVHRRSGHPLLPRRALTLLTEDVGDGCARWRSWPGPS